MNWILAFPNVYFPLYPYIIGIRQGGRHSPWDNWERWISSVQSLSRVRLFVTAWTAACQASLSITNSKSLFKLMSTELVMPSSHLILSSSSPAFNLPSASGSFKWVSSLYQAAKGWKFQLQPSVLPMNIQDWFPLGWTGWISLKSKGLSRVFSNTTVQKHQFFDAQLSL